MTSLEITAKSVDEAIAQAADQLSVPTEAITATVLEETKGLFGKVQYRVLAEVKPLQEVPVKKVKTLFGKSKARAPQVIDDAPAPNAEPEVAEKAAPAPKAVRASRSKATPKEVEAPTEVPADQAPSEEPTLSQATQADADQLLGALEQLLKSGDLDVKAKVAGMSGRYVNISLDGKDVSVLVGKHGEVLNALQYLVNIIGNQQFGNGIRVTLDGDDYRKRREEKLAKLAEAVATQVKERGEEAVLDALPAFERRIVHKVLSEFEGVSTYSEGEEPNRRVVIAPAD